jgi:hypothetical protein
MLDDWRRSILEPIFKIKVTFKIILIIEKLNL